jgi:ElaB/YqjD/DUF883 family membrane-anchored ribosome-binding protein
MVALRHGPPLDALKREGLPDEAGLPSAEVVRFSSHHSTNRDQTSKTQHPMTDSKNTPSPSEKLESSQLHAKKALEATAAAAREVAEAAKSGARSAYSTGRGELEAAAHDLKDVARHTYDGLSKAAKSTYDGLANEARERYSHLAEEAGEAVAQYMAQFDELTEEAEDYVRDNPFKAVGITFAAGLLLGLLLRRK